MREPRIKGGYILLSRKLIESEIFKKPPLYLKVWIYLLSRAQHKEYEELKRGELWTSVPEIQEACSWYVGYRKVTPTYKEVYSVIEWLRRPCERICERTTKVSMNGSANGNMIGTTKGTQGMLVNIENYYVYQDPKNYERNTESNIEGEDERVTKEPRTEFEGNNINKNDKNDKNDKNNNISSKDDGIYKVDSENLWKLYPRKLGKKKAMGYIPKLLKKYGFEQMKRCIERYKLSEDFKKGFIQHGSTFFNGAFLDYLDENYDETKESNRKTITRKVADF